MSNYEMEKLNKIHLSVVIITFICIASCAPKDYYIFSEEEYQRKRTEAVKFLYIVDTIQIDNPVLFEIDGYNYVCADTIVMDKTIDDSLFERQDVYPYMDSFCWYMTEDDFERAYKGKPHAELNGRQVNVRYKNRALLTSRFDKPHVAFLLGLINHDYYDKVARCADYLNKRLKIKGSQNNYIKIVTCY